MVLLPWCEPGLDVLRDSMPRGMAAREDGDVRGGTCLEGSEGEWGVEVETSTD